MSPTLRNSQRSIHLRNMERAARVPDGPFECRVRGPIRAAHGLFMPKEPSWHVYRKWRIVHTLSPKPVVWMTIGRVRALSNILSHVANTSQADCRNRDMRLRG